MPSRSAHSSAFALCCLSTIGCTVVETIETALPADPGSTSLLLVTERSTSSLVDVQAFDLAGADGPSFAFKGVETDEDFRFTAAFYREPLTELRLTAGPQPTAADFCWDVAKVDGRTPRALFSRSIRGDAIEELASVSELSETLLNVRIQPGVSACVAFKETFDVETIPLDATNDSSVIARLHDGSVLVGTHGFRRQHTGTFWIVTDLGTESQLERVDVTDLDGQPFADMPGDEPTWTAVQLTSGIILLSDRISPWLWEAELRRDAVGPKLVVTSSRSNAMGDLRRYKWIAQNELGEAEEIFALSTEGSFERWTREGAELLHDFGALTGFLAHAAIVRSGPNEAFAGFNTSGSVAHYRDGRVFLEPVTEAGGLSALGQHPDGSVYAGSALGGLFVREAEGAWRQVRDLALGAPLTAIIPWRGGLLLAGTDGFVGRVVVPSDGRERFYVCRQALSHSVRLNALLGERAIVLTGSLPPSSLEPYVEILRPKSDVEPFPHCVLDSAESGP